MRVLVACEFTGTVRDAFIRRGHDAWSCDLPGVEPEGEFADKHIADDVRNHLQPGRWDLMIAHPVCTRLTNAGARWLVVPPKGRTLDEMWAEFHAGIALFRTLLEAPVPRKCLENPIQHRHARALLPKYTQIVQPWQYGHGETKATCLWLRNLLPLQPTNIVSGREARIHRMSPGPDRGKERSRFYPGIAAAMADQWGSR